MVYIKIKVAPCDATKKGHKKMEQITEIKNLKKGEFFKRLIKGQPSAKVYIKGDYDRATKTYSAIEYEDVNHEIFLKANTKVNYGFTF